ncbi:helix-turn-helix domain-containing protein [Aeoliella mucimassa]|uniref:HTH cro/C1-type domain-containing protein n=1 Tax=Aeoliella mucimassa TaxID=2527972 RepID=A0A518ATJ1_9BACT|nr:helix-turn-helix transcriptional regulator [Aeoliella mucimassa]QDU58026.1 hypothetical protein Pan181_42510 [Aeoliella mucimassa]
MSKAGMNLIEFITSNTAYNQADLARALNVSRAQISRWKAGEAIPRNRETELLEIGGLFSTVCTDWAMFARTEANAENWYIYFTDILSGSEWGWALKDLYRDSPDKYSSHVIRTLLKLGADIPFAAPSARELDGENVESTPLASALYGLFDAWAQIHDWVYLAFDTDDCGDQFDLFEISNELEWLTFDLGVLSVDIDCLRGIGIKEKELDEFHRKTVDTIEVRLHQFCLLRTQNGYPIKHDYFNLLDLSPIELAEQAFMRNRDGKNRIMNYLSYGEQMCISRLDYSVHLLSRIDEKLDVLLKVR